MGTIETVEAGHLCPICNADCSPIGEPCSHFLYADTEAGVRWSEFGRELAAICELQSPLLFRESVYHDETVREFLEIRRGLTDEQLELYVYATNRDSLKSVIERVSR